MFRNTFSALGWISSGSGLGPFTPSGWFKIFFLFLYISISGGLAVAFAVGPSLACRNGDP